MKKRWVVVSVIATVDRKPEIRIMRTTWTKRGAEGWADFYASLLQHLHDEQPIPVPDGFTHGYTVLRRADWMATVEKYGRGDFVDPRKHMPAMEWKP